MEIYVNAGELRERIRIVERNTERDADGYEVRRDDPAYWKDVQTCRARFSQPSGTETIRAGADFTVEKGFEGNGGNVEAAKKIGALVAERALKKGIEEVVFDRGGYIYHGRVQALADGAREAGLKF